MALGKLMGIALPKAVTTTVRKTADQVVNNSEALQDDDELLLAIAANEVWLVLAFLIGNSSGGADFKFSFTAPGGATGGFFGDIAFATVDGTHALPIRAFGYERTAAGGDADKFYMLWALVINSTTAGNLQFQWAQDSAEVSDSKILANSCLIGWQLT